MPKKVLITGASGFIGRNLVEGVSGIYDIFTPTHKELELTDPSAVALYFKGKNFDAVIHCATKPGYRFAKDRKGILDANSRMFSNLVKHSDRFEKLIHIGSGAVYDPMHYLPKMKEEYFGRHVPEDESSRSKWLISKFIEESENMVDLRIFGVFGRYEEYAIRFISNAICKAIFDLPITLKQNRRFDYLDISDLLPIVQYFIGNDPAYKAYNVTPTASFELYELAKKVREISKKNLPIKVAAEGMGLEYSGDNGRLKNEMKELKFTDIDVSIKRLYAWYLENKGSISKELLLVDY